MDIVGFMINIIIISRITAMPLISSKDVPATVLDIHATCDDNLEVYADGMLLGTSDDTNEVQHYPLSFCPQVVAVKCHDDAVLGGIYINIANDDVSYATDSSWKCIASTTDPSPFWKSTDFIDDMSWNPAVEIRDTLWSRRTFEGISSSSAKWIWTTNDIGVHRTVYCRKIISGCGGVAAPVVVETTPVPTTAEPTTAEPTTPVAPTTVEPDTTELHIDELTTAEPIVEPSTGYNCAKTETNPCHSGMPKPYHFPHEILGMFVQCDTFGRCWDMPCSPGMVWDVDTHGCNWPKSPVVRVCPPGLEWDVDINACNWPK